MKDRRRRERPLPPPSTSSSSRISWLKPLFLLLLCALFLSVAFNTFRLFDVSFRPVLRSTWQTSPAMNAVSSTDHQSSNTYNHNHPPPFRIQQAISFPDLILLFPKPLNFNYSHQCLYFPPSSSTPKLNLPPLTPPSQQFIKCPVAPRNFLISLSLSLPPIRSLSWDHLAYAAVLDLSDNTTVVFAKGFNLRPARLSDPTRFLCLFGYHFSNLKYAIASPAVSAAQEIVRCKTPLSVLRRPESPSPPLVSVRTIGRGSITLPSVARPEIISLHGRTKHRMCVCTMVRNQARFLREWITYHTRIGVERWFIYDNNSDDDIEQVVEGMSSVSLHEWPWIKSQEAGFAHCGLRAKGSCEWVGFIDVDEFLYLPSNVTFHDVLRNYSRKPWVGELRITCHSFGPSGRKKIPEEGVMVGYTCRMAAPERHKSIVRPEALNPSLITVVHHFHLREGKRYVNIERGVMGINHYKYQVWEVFKEKFYRRVATYVADWQDEENVGSKDRAPGLGTKAVEPPDWSSRFCEVKDTGLRDWVRREFVDHKTGLLPW